MTVLDYLAYYHNLQLKTW